MLLTTLAYQRLLRTCASSSLARRAKPSSSTP